MSQNKFYFVFALVSVLWYTLLREASEPNKQRCKTMAGKALKAGDKAGTIYGKIETVLSVDDSRVVTEQSSRQQAWYHPTKVWQMFWSQNLRRWVTIPE